MPQNSETEKQSCNYIYEEINCEQRKRKSARATETESETDRQTDRQTETETSYPVFTAERLEETRHNFESAFDVFVTNNLCTHIRV